MDKQGQDKAGSVILYICFPAKKLYEVLHNIIVYVLMYSFILLVNDTWNA